MSAALPAQAANPRWRDDKDAAPGVAAISATTPMAAQVIAAQATRSAARGVSGAERESAAGAALERALARPRHDSGRRARPQSHGAP